MGFFQTLFGLRDTSASNLADVIAKGAFLVDVRSPQEYKSGSVKGATNIPLDVIVQQLHKFKGKEHIVVFCRSGNRSGQAQRLLKQNGYSNVTNGGTWQNVNELIIK